METVYEPLATTGFGVATTEVKAGGFSTMIVVPTLPDI